MNIKDFSLSLDRTDVVKSSRPQYQVFIIILSALVVLLAAATIFFSLSAVKPDVSSGIAVETHADAARWNARGDYYRAKALEVEHGAAANSARWEAMGENYKSAAFDVDRYMTTTTARWKSMGAYYTVGNNDVTEADSARYQAMGEWFSRQK